MSMTQQAPLIEGPWIVGPGGDVWMSADIEMVDGKWRETCPEPRIIASPSALLNREDEAKVARLIAAAPDLLAALRRALPLLAKSAHPYNHEHRACEIAHAAISKATGART